MTKNKLNILFICTGNICRSPMAEYLLRRRLGPNSVGVTASAGLAAADGLPASQTAVAVMDEIGIDIRPHRSRELTPELIDAATIILVMTEDHALELKRRFPKTRDRVHLLGSFHKDPANHVAGGPAVGNPGQSTPAAEKDISDPVGASIDFYRRTRNDIAGCLDGLIDYLKTYSVP